ncbi:MAG: hypothetical protein KDB01_09100 [Planctomycetaceae bacterium]|nr:hypothetical protein [Planctomycetaceae bacterium]
MWNRIVSKQHLGTAAMMLALSGCTALSDCKYEVGQKIRTQQAWHEFDGCHNQCFTCDYSTGWKAGFYDVATGGDGCPPVIAPKRYWKPPVFVEYDPGRRDDWYRGFQDGAAYAKCQPDHHYLKTFLPPRTCCPTHIVSHSTVMEPDSGLLPEYVESLQSFDIVAPETPAPVEPAAPAPAAPAPAAPAQPAVEPATENSTPPVEGGYEDDPAPENNQPTSKVNSPLQQQLVRQYQAQQQANSMRASLLEQLVINAGQPSHDSEF